MSQREVVFWSSDDNQLRLKGDYVELRRLLLRAHRALDEKEVVVVDAQQLVIDSASYTRPELAAHRGLTSKATEFLNRMPSMTNLKQVVVAWEGFASAKELAELSGIPAKLFMRGIPSQAAPTVFCPRAVDNMSGAQLERAKTLVGQWFAGDMVLRVGEYEVQVQEQALEQYAHLGCIVHRLAQHPELKPLFGGLRRKSAVRGRKRAVSRERLQRIETLAESGATLVEIGEQLGITKQRVQQIIKKHNMTSPQAARNLLVRGQREAHILVISGLWKDGLPLEEIARVLGAKYTSLATNISHWRKKDPELFPYRLPRKNKI